MLVCNDEDVLGNTASLWSCCIAHVNACVLISLSPNSKSKPKNNTNKDSV